MIPERTEYKGQSYKLYDDYNDIHIFIEDAGFENLYRELFSKYDVNVENIFSMNGKDSVLKAARSCSDSKCVYVVDKDWDDLLGKIVRLKNVVVLGMNSIESYLIDHNAFSKVVLAEQPKCDIDSLLGDAGFKDILVEVSNALRPLFECFAAMQMSSSGCKGCSYGPSHFQVKNKTCAPDEDMIDDFVSTSEVLISESVKSYFSDESLNKNGHGKYMLHYLWQAIRQRAKVKNIRMNVLMMRLAQLVKSPELSSLVYEIKGVGVK